MVKTMNAVESLCRKLFDEESVSPEEFREVINKLEAYAWRMVELDRPFSGDWQRVAESLCDAHNAAASLIEE